MRRLAAAFLLVIAAAGLRVAADEIRGRGSFSQSGPKPLGPTALPSGGTSPKLQGNRLAEIENIPDPFFRLGRTLPNGRSRIERIAENEYIAQVLAGEGQPRAADAAQEALAITARTFAMANRNRHRSEGFDLCDTTHCQVVRPATTITRMAADATSGRVVLHQGQRFDTDDPDTLRATREAAGRRARRDGWPARAIVTL